MLFILALFTAINGVSTCIYQISESDNKYLVFVFF